MESPKKPKWFINFLKISFIIFIVIYISIESGYYENRISKRTIMTNENIKKFETDVKNGVNVDINDYIIEENKDYSNTVTKVGNYISNKVGVATNKCIIIMSDVLKRLF